MSDEHPNCPKSSPKPPFWWIFAGPLAIVIVVLIVIGALSFFDSATTISAIPSTSSSPPVPKIDYQALISAETGKAKTQIGGLVKAHQASLAKLDQTHAPKFALAASSASEQAAKFGSITKLIAYLAWDKAKGTSEAESYLNTLIEPSISPALVDFHNDVNAETAKIDYELRKVTVQLASNIAAIGPGDASPPPRIDSSEDTLRDFQQILKSLGKDATVQVLVGTVGPPMIDVIVKRVLPTLIRPISAIAGRMFAKQIAKVAALPAILSATGAVPIGAIVTAAVTVLGAAWTLHDIYKIGPDFQDEVYQKLKINLDEIRNSAIVQASQATEIKSEEIRKIQSEIGAKALEDYTKSEVK